MAKATDPPSAERKSTEFWKWVRGIFRKLVARRTLIIAFSIVLWTARVVRLLKLFGGF